MTLPPRPRLWEVPTILSLDAPLVAVLWQSVLAAGLGVRLAPRHHVLLAASVWLVYVADRWLDAFRMDAGLPQTRRHRFHLEWRWPLLAVWLWVLLVASLYAGLSLTRTELEAGFLLLAGALAYLALVHLPWLATPLSKEVLVAALFAAGVALFPAVAPRAAAPWHAGWLWPALSLFALLCFLNTALIARWELRLDLAQGQASLLAGRPWLDSLLRPLGWLLAVAPLVGWLLAPAAGLVWASLVASSLALLALERGASRLSAPALRVLADVALLVPVLLVGLEALTG